MYLYIFGLGNTKEVLGLISSPTYSFTTMTRILSTEPEVGPVAYHLTPKHHQNKYFLLITSLISGFKCVFLILEPLFPLTAIRNLLCKDSDNNLRIFVLY